jgi:hypothetical protein
VIRRNSPLGPRQDEKRDSLPRGRGQVIFIVMPIVIPLCLAIGIAAPFIADSADRHGGFASHRRQRRAKPFGHRLLVPRVLSHSRRPGQRAGAPDTAVWHDDANHDFITDTLGFPPPFRWMSLRTHRGGSGRRGHQARANAIGPVWLSAAGPCWRRASSARAACTSSAFVLAWSASPHRPSWPLASRTQVRGPAARGPWRPGPFEA